MHAAFTVSRAYILSGGVRCSSSWQWSSDWPWQPTQPTPFRAWVTANGSSL